MVAQKPRHPVASENRLRESPVLGQARSRAATFLPIFLLPEFAFKFVPFAPSLEGQYILKNLVLVSAGWAVVAPYFRSGAVSEGASHGEVDLNKADRTYVRSESPASN